MRWLALMALVGCGTTEVVQPTTAREGQEEAIAVVLGVWGQPRVPFALEWVSDECGWPGSVRSSAGTCAAGVVEWDTPPTVRVGLEAPDELFSQTSLAHELCHVYFGDQEHARECGTVRPFTVVLAAEKALRDAGL